MGFNKSVVKLYLRSLYHSLIILGVPAGIFFLLYGSVVLLTQR